MWKDEGPLGVAEGHAPLALTIIIMLALSTFQILDLFLNESTKNMSLSVRLLVFVLLAFCEILVRI